MIQHKSSDQFLKTGIVASRSIHLFKRCRFWSRADNIDDKLSAIPLPALASRGAENEMPDTTIKQGKILIRLMKLYSEGRDVFPCDFCAKIDFFALNDC